MCYETNDRPPVPPGQAGSAHGEDIELQAKDGNRFAAYQARPAGGGAATSAEVLIFPDVRGLHGFYKDLANRFAEQGTGALAIDYFGRTAGMTPRDDSFEYMTHVQQLKGTTLLADISAALDYLRSGKSGTGGNGEHIFTLGFCMGGSLCLLAGTQDFRLAGVIAFYSGLGRKFEGIDGTVLELADRVRYPFLGLYGGADQGIPASDRDKLDKALNRAGVEHEIVVYPGAPHSFFDRKAEEFSRESADAWTRVLSFIRAHSGQTTAV